MNSPRLDPVFLGAPLAHRGYHDTGAGRPENSRAAIRAAVDRGFGIEIDLQLSADGQAMVFHDHDLKRLTGLEGQLHDRSAAALGDIALLHGHRETIPTLADILSDVDGRSALLIELKDQTGVLGETDGALETATARALKGYRGPVALMSFNPYMVATLARLVPDIPRGLTTCDFSGEEWPGVPAATLARHAGFVDFEPVGASFISHDVADLDNPHIERVRNAGAAILCWTVTSPEMETRARRIVDNITFEGYLPGA